MTASKIYESLDELADNLFRIQREQILIVLSTIVAGLGFMWLFVYNALEWNHWEVTVGCGVALVTIAVTMAALLRISKSNYINTKKKMKDKLEQLLETQRELGFVNEDIRTMHEMLKEEEENARKG